MGENTMIKVIGGDPILYSEGQFRLDLLPMRAPSGTLPDEFLAEYEVYRPVMSLEPESTRTSIAFLNEVPELIENVWTWTWRMESKPYTLAEAKTAMAQWINNLTGQIQDEYPDVVQKGWEDEEAMAEAYFLDVMSQDQTDTLTADARAQGRTSQEHAQRILDKAQVFRMIKKVIRTLWLETDKALGSAADPAEYESILAAAIEKAKPMAESYGLEVWVG